MDYLGGRGSQTDMEYRLVQKESLEIEGKSLGTEEEYSDCITYRKALLDIAKASIPSALGLIFEMLVEVINMMFIGHLNDPVALGAVGLGNMLVNMVCFSIGTGINGAVDTLVSQAYGDKEYYLCGCYL